MCGKLFKKFLILSLTMVLLSFNLSAYWFQQSPETKTLSGTEVIVKEVEVPVEVPVEVIREVIKEIPIQADILKVEEIQTIINKELQQLVIPEDTLANSKLLTNLEANLDIVEESLKNSNESLIEAEKEIDYLLTEKNKTHFGFGFTTTANLDIWNKPKYDIGTILTLRKDSLILLGGVSTDINSINENMKFEDFKITAGVIYEF